MGCTASCVLPLVLSVISYTDDPLGSVLYVTTPESGDSSEVTSYSGVVTWSMTSLSKAPEGTCVSGSTVDECGPLPKNIKIYFNSKQLSDFALLINNIYLATDAHSLER